MVARTAGRADARGREQAVLAHQAQDAVLGRAHARVPQPGPHLAVPLAVKRAAGKDGPDVLRQRRIQHRSWWPRTLPRLGPGRSAVRPKAGQTEMAIEGGTCRAPEPAGSGTDLGAWSCPHQTEHGAGFNWLWMNSRGERICKP